MSAGKVWRTGPTSIVAEALTHTLFPRSTPTTPMSSARTPIFKPPGCETVRFFRQYYVPNNATIAIVGDADSAQVRQLVDEIFRLAASSGADVPKVRAVTPPITAERRVVIEDRIELPRVYMAWLTPPAFQPGEVEARLLAHILGGGDSSRLHQKLVTKNRLRKKRSPGPSPTS